MSNNKPIILQHTYCRSRYPLGNEFTDIINFMFGGAVSVIDIGNELIEAKKATPHGQWGKWLKNNFNMSYGTALNYMKIARYFNQPIFEEYDNELFSEKIPYTTLLELTKFPVEDTVRIFKKVFRKSEKPAAD